MTWLVDGRGTIHVPDGDVKSNGSSGEILPLRDQDRFVKFSPAGPV